jgi:ubiquinone/menaquinone biosynthesis C-methylase UbiE
MGIYEKYFLPKLLNMAMKSPELSKLRSQLVPMATGKVLEVGIGSGLNLPFYQKGVHVTGVDPSVELKSYAQEVADEHNLAVEFLSQGCADLPIEKDTFDTAVVTWSLCTIPDPLEALEEIRRVLKPNGKLVFIEHGKSNEAKVARLQNRINPLWRVIGGGCNLNRQPDDMINNNGFKLETLTEGYIPGPKFATYNYRGIASIA